MPLGPLLGLKIFTLLVRKHLYKKEIEPVLESKILKNKGIH